jgi:flagellar biosynthetic protein FliR
MTGATLLAFARCAGFAARAPGFGHPSVPPLVRAMVAIGLTLAVAPSVHVVRAPNGLEFLLAFSAEALLGAAIGAFASLLYDGAYAGGRVVDDYAGVRAIAPSVALVAPSGFGRIWSLVFTGGFFLSGAYQVAILAFADSFALVPPGGALGRDAILAYATALPQTIVLVALAVAGPAIALAFVVQVALAAIARVVPRLGSVTLASPLVFAAAILATAVSIPALEQLAARPPVQSWLVRANVP